MFYSELYFGNSSSRAPSMRSYVTVYGTRAWCAQMPPSQLLNCVPSYLIYFLFHCKIQFLKHATYYYYGINIIINISTLLLVQTSF